MSYNAELRFRQNRFSVHLAYLINFIQSGDLTMSMGEVYRTEYQQAEYLRQGLTQTLDSMHLKRLAVDINFFDKDYLLFSDQTRLNEDKEAVRLIGEYWQDLNAQNFAGMFWDFADYGHFEHRF